MPFGEYAGKALGLRLPEEYVRFMEKYGKKLSADPVTQKSWVDGLGDADFVVGTTLAFRTGIPSFSMENVVIGYSGTKTVVINKSYQKLDVYILLNVRDGRVLSIDSLGVTETMADSFEDWIGPELLRATFKERYESTLTVILFESEAQAAEAREKLLELQRRKFIDLDDIVVVVKEPDGTTRHQQQPKKSRKGIVIGSITGLIAGSLLFNPLVGTALGALAAAVSASLSDSNMGIDGQFIRDLVRKFTPGSSALFTLVRKADPEKLREAFLGFGGKVLVNSLSRDTEAAVQAILDAKDGYNA